MARSRKTFAPSTPAPAELTLETPSAAEDEALDAGEVAAEPDASDEVTLPDVLHVDVVVQPAAAVSLVYEGTGPRVVEIEGYDVTLYPGALITLPVIGDVKTLVAEGVLRRLGAA